MPLQLVAKGGGHHSRVLGTQLSEIVAYEATPQAAHAIAPNVWRWRYQEQRRDRWAASAASAMPSPAVGLRCAQLDAALCHALTPAVIGAADGVLRRAACEHLQRLRPAGGAPLFGRPDASGAGASEPLQPQDSFEHFYLQNQAAACGLGVAIAPEILVEGEIARGHLVAPFGFVDGPHELNLWIAPHLRSRPDVKRLANWIEETMHA